MNIKLLGYQSEEALRERVKFVAGAGKLSRFLGDVFDVLDSCVDYEKNLNLIKRIVKMGHESITDHDYLVFAIKDVTPVVEQLLIKERIVSFTIKSRREVDFRDSGFYTPSSFVGELKDKYEGHMEWLFGKYAELVESGVSKEDARFVLPYSYYSNIIMGCDAHVLKNIIVRFTKGKESAIAEVREVGERLLEIVRENVPYLVEIIENAECGQMKVDRSSHCEYNILNEVELLSSTENVDKTIATSSLMRLYQVNKTQAGEMLDGLDLQKIVYDINDDFEKLDFTQVNFRFQIPISLAVLTHITRHRTHDILVPDFVPNHNLEFYKIPPTVKDVEGYKAIFAKNKEIYDWFVSQGVSQEDLVYFHLSGNMVNIITNMNGKALAWFCRLRRCMKAQWEIRVIANQMAKLVSEKAECFGKVLAPDCEVRRVCGEGRESCGRLDVILKKLEVSS